MRLTLLLAIAITAATAHACLSDWDCDGDSTCHVNWGEGTCVARQSMGQGYTMPTQGLQQAAYRMQDTLPMPVQQCQYDHQCGFRGTCVKQGYANSGYCQ